MSEQTLTPEQRRAAAQLAEGKQVKDVAADLSIDKSTLGRWKHIPEFTALIRHHREGLVPETATAEATLTAALSATRKDGTPAWEHRIAAAKALLSAPVTSDPAREQAARVERIFLSPEEVNGNGDSQ